MYEQQKAARAAKYTSITSIWRDFDHTTTRRLYHHALLPGHCWSCGVARCRMSMKMMAVKEQEEEESEKWNMVRVVVPAAERWRFLKQQQHYQQKQHHQQ
mmetsp:Transcript_34928/g.62889  ORF Transcript_34928/g.62889 Transcript_34928/m.62889 type:complete len:100 (-) Transcript_34928:3-302(-)